MPHDSKKTYRMEEKMRKTHSIAGLLLAMFLICLAGCGESKPDNRNIQPGPSPSPKPVVPLTGPQQFQVTGIDGALQIRFTRVADAQGIPARYDLRYGTGNSFASAIQLGTNVLQVSGLLVSGEITGLTNGQTYYVWINAVFDTLGQSTYHMETGMPVPTPDAPESIVATAYETLIDIEWPPSQYAFSYEVAYHTANNPNAGAVVRRTATEPRLMITTDLNGNPLRNDTTYYIWVRASNTDGVSGYSDVITATPAAASAVPAAPGALSVEPGRKRLKVTWDAVQWAVSYELWYNTVHNQVFRLPMPNRTTVA